ncbi:MAG: ORF6N domain-containing protein [Bacteroidota bacterium]
MSKSIHLTDDLVINKIYFIRGKKVMLDADLAEMYGVETKNLKRQVKRNLPRFPQDFMFELSLEELYNLRCQIGTSSSDWGGTRYAPMAFTEQGVAMLSSVLNSETAIEVNIHIIRIFTRIRETLSSEKEILVKLERIEHRLLSQEVKNNRQDHEIGQVFKVLKSLVESPKQEREKVGYKIAKKD